LFQRISVWPLQAKKHLPGEMHDAPSSFPPSVCLSRAKQQHANTRRAHFRFHHFLTFSQLSLHGIDISVVTGAVDTTIVTCCSFREAQ
jgi:hypothetical protein